MAVGEHTGSAERWGPLWGARPADWALTEDLQVPTYEAALEGVVVDGAQVLDIGCGAGAFLRLVAERGGEAHGIDASDALIAFARTRLLDADLRDDPGIYPPPEVKAKLRPNLSKSAEFTRELNRAWTRFTTGG